MVSSMRGNAIGDGEVVDGNVVSKARDVGDNYRMTCGVEVSRGGVEYAGYESLGGWCGILVWYGSFKGWCGILVWYGSFRGWCGILMWYGSLINGTTCSMTTRSTTT